MHDGRDADDDWRIGRGGFRLDWTPSANDTIAVQGDVYDGNLDQNYLFPSLFPPYAERRLSPVDTSGGSLQARCSSSSKRSRLVCVFMSRAFPFD